MSFKKKLSKKLNPSSKRMSNNSMSELLKSAANSFKKRNCEFCICRTEMEYYTKHIINSASNTSKTAEPLLYFEDKLKSLEPVTDVFNFKDLKSKFSQITKGIFDNKDTLYELAQFLLEGNLPIRSMDITTTTTTLSNIPNSEYNYNIRYGMSIQLFDDWKEKVQRLKQFIENTETEEHKYDLEKELMITAPILGVMVFKTKNVNSTDDYNIHHIRYWGVTRTSDNKIVIYLAGYGLPVNPNPNISFEEYYKKETARLNHISGLCRPSNPYEEWKTVSANYDSYNYLTLWLQIQQTLLNPHIKKIDKKPRQNVTSNKITKKYVPVKDGKYTYEKTVYTVNSDSIEEALDELKEVVIVREKRVISCDLYHVTGHWRQYKNGRTIWIEGYWKGRDRNNVEKIKTVQARNRGLITSEGEKIL